MKPCDYNLDKFILSINSRKQESKLILKNEITFSMSFNLKTSIPNYLFSKYDHHLISNKINYYRLSIFLTVLCDTRSISVSNSVFLASLESTNSFITVQTRFKNL